VNSEMPRFVVEKVRDALNDQTRSLKGSHVLVLGVAYKRDIDDIRESPALDIIHLLEDKGATVSYHDPHVPELHEDGRVRRSVPLTSAVLDAVNCVLIATDHSDVDYSQLIGLPVPVVDTRNAMRGMDSDNLVGLSGRARGGPLESVLLARP
jgi:UDP-N-acetyl-D-glucosamine dehydrogenase